MSFAEALREIQSGAVSTSEVQELRTAVTGYPMVKPPSRKLPPNPPAEQLLLPFAKTHETGFTLLVASQTPKMSKPYPVADDKSSDEITNVMAAADGYVDKTMWSTLQSQKSYKSDISVWWPRVNKASQWIVTSGPLVGLYQRLGDGMARKRMIFPTTGKGHANLIKSLEKHLPLRAIPAISALGTPDAPSNIADAWLGLEKFGLDEINKSSNSGLPFQVNKLDSLPQDIKLAEEFARALNGTATQIKQFIKTHPEFSTLLVRNKTDHYQMSETQKKIRPYFIWPAATLYNLQPVTRVFHHMIAPFWEDKNSVSALGFSFMKGDSWRFLDLLLSIPVGKSKVISYGDDALWIRHTTEGWEVAAPDVIQMDLSISHTLTGAIRPHLIKRLRELKVPDNWILRLDLAMSLSFRSWVSVYKKIVALKTEGNSSGGPLTTEINEIVYAIVADTIEGILNAGGSFETAFKALKANGLEIKPTTMGVKMVTHETVAAYELMRKEAPGSERKWDIEPLLPVYFLGRMLCVDPVMQRDLVGVPEPERLTRSVLLPKLIKTDNNEYQRKRMASVFGQALCGGCFYEPLYDALKAKWDMLKGTFCAQDDGEDYQVDEVSWLHAVLESAKKGPVEFPTREQFAYAYYRPEMVPDEIKVVGKVPKSGAEPVVLQREVKSLSIFDDMFSTDNWADLVEKDEDERHEAATQAAKEGNVAKALAQVHVPDVTTTSVTHAQLELPDHRGAKKIAQVLARSTPAEEKAHEIAKREKKILRDKQIALKEAHKLEKEQRRVKGGDVRSAARAVAEADEAPFPEVMSIEDKTETEASWSPGWSSDDEASFDAHEKHRGGRAQSDEVTVSSAFLSETEDE